MIKIVILINFSFTAQDFLTLFTLLFTISGQLFTSGAVYIYESNFSLADN